MMKDEKEKWIESVMQSLDGMQQAEVNPFLYAKILRRLEKPESTQTAFISPLKMKLLLGGFLLLMFFNIATALNYGRAQSGSQATHLMTEYDFLPE